MAFSSRWKQWCKRSPNTCCSKKILLLLVWNILIRFSRDIPSLYGPDVHVLSSHLYLIFNHLSLTFAPFIGWLADVKFGRYETIKFGTIISFLTSILFYFELIIEERSTLTNALQLVAVAVQSFGSACFVASMLPFLTDQLIGATSDELSAVVQWYAWTSFLGSGLSEAVIILGVVPYLQLVGTGFAFVIAIPLAVIIISDCLCQQWLNKTHKATNPIKLIIQVLNYTRKHRYPERRSAFTYIDEEQPTRMDFGKGKFGGPFTEEEVEDVKTVLRLIPLIVCLSFIGGAKITPANLLKLGSSRLFFFIDVGSHTWLFPLLLIPVYRLLLHRFIHRYTPSMLNSIVIGLVMYLVGYIALEALVIKGVVDSDDVQSYLSCTTNTTLAHPPDEHVEWYWKLGPYLIYGVGNTITTVLLYELIIAQSPDKMKGFVLGVMLACLGITVFVAAEIFTQVNFTLCSQLSLTILVVTLFVVFLVLSKCYTLRERNREINIQAIVEEHYERYMDQEEEYTREQRNFREEFSISTSNSDLNACSRVLSDV